MYFFPAEKRKQEIRLKKETLKLKREELNNPELPKSLTAKGGLPFQLDPLQQRQVDQQLQQQQQQQQFESALVKHISVKQMH